ncbi:MAG: type II toxin-antitoxin system HipA family toxin [Oceanospirillales bacterium]|nr:MAG: type II toxin-antitoxin system HipA family toxin [Oceanospirillales bacterium]
MTEKVARYSIFVNTEETGLILAAKVGLLEKSGILQRFQFRYLSNYLDHSGAFPLDPVTLPLTSADINLSCNAGGMPAVLDDYLPDAWGKRVLARLAFFKKQLRLREQSPLDILPMIGSSRIGAIQWVAEGDDPIFELGADISRIADAEKTAHAIDSEDYHADASDEFSLAYLANAGTGVGGARPKALIEDKGVGYLAKFNSLTKDVYNNARVELACIRMAKDAGISMTNAKVISGINDREVLLIERFDVSLSYRMHLITVNGMLKDPNNQCDRGGAFFYDDVARLIRKFSYRPEADLEQLLRMMFFNAVINNTDDHERNFSFCHNKDGYCLAPAYDMVPSLAVGQYHVAGYNYSPYPLYPSKATGKVFGLSSTKVKEISEEVLMSTLKWKMYAESAGVADQDIEKIQNVFSY